MAKKKNRTASGEQVLSPRSSKARLIADRIRDEIIRRCRPRDMIPSERDLAERFGVARNTLRKALAELSDEGWLRRVRGDDHLVTGPRAEPRYSSGLFFPLNAKVLMGEKFYREIYQGIGEVAGENRRHLLTFYGLCEQFSHLTAADFWSPDIRAIDSLVTIEVFDEQVIDQAAQLYPVVSLESHSKLPASASTISFDHALSMRMAVKYLMDLGHRRIGFIGRTQSPDPAIGIRWNGFQEAMRWAGLPLDERWIFSYKLPSPFGPLVRRWQETPPAQRATALITADIFWFVYHRFTATGIRIPGDLSLLNIGVLKSWAEFWADGHVTFPSHMNELLKVDVQEPFANSPPELATVRPTTLALPAVRMGREGMNELLRRLGDPQSEPRHQLLNPELIVGETTAAPPAG